MQIVQTLHPTGPRLASAEEVIDLELRGTWVVDVRRHPRQATRTGWLVDWEDDIVFLIDEPLPLGPLPVEPLPGGSGSAESPATRWPLDAA